MNGRVSMARTIKFRAKRFDNKEWVYGMLATLEETTIIIEKPGVFNDGSASPFFTNWQFVDKKTIGQFTGLYDSDGKEIYEGDILTIPSIPDYAKEVVVFRNGCFNVRSFGFYESMASVETSERSIIGNIYDNQY